MRTPNPHIVIHPGMPTNRTKVFLVVHADEWVAVILGEKKEYAFTSEHPDYATAAAEQVRLNRRPTEFPPMLLDDDEAETEPMKSGVSLQRSTT